ncbi:amidohydrolase [Nocardioides sp. zg-ZUI104]|nr:amidohydrolase [Nocardioides faecalis]
MTGATVPAGTADGAAEASAVRALWEPLGIPGIVDVHTHFMPDRVLRKVWAYFDQVGPLTGRTWPITYRFDEERRIEILRDLGVRRFTSLNYPHRAGMAQWLNEWSAEFAASYEACLHSATFYPEPGAGAYVAAAIDAGAQVFKAHVQVGDYDPNDPLLDPVWEVLAERRVPVVIHAGHGPAPGTFTGPAGMARLLQRYPGLVLVVAHMGLPDYGAFLDLVEQHDGVHLDTTMAFTRFTEETAPFPRAELPRLRDLGQRVLFGSDFPNIPYPYLESVRAVVDLDLGDDWLRGVLHDNAVRLFGLD